MYISPFLSHSLSCIRALPSCSLSEFTSHSSAHQAPQATYQIFLAQTTGAVPTSPQGRGLEYEQNHLVLLQLPEDGCNLQTIAKSHTLYSAPLPFIRRKSTSISIAHFMTEFDSQCGTLYLENSQSLPLRTGHLHPCQLQPMMSFLVIEKDSSRVTVVRPSCLQKGELVL